MKRYIYVSFSLLIVSLLNAMSWICLGFSLGNSQIANVFSLTYPVAFLLSIILSIFGTGANVRKNIKNDRTNNTVYSGWFWGIFFGAIILGILTIFSKNYVSFMHMDIAFFNHYTKFSMLQAFAWLVLQLVTEKLYFEEHDSRANIYSIIFFVLSFGGLIITSLFTKNEIIILYVTLAIILLYTAIIFILHLKKFKFEWNFLPNIRYDSVAIFSSLFFFITYFIGFSNAFMMGEKYVVALNLVNLITDPQWDALGAIGKLAKIDLSIDNYNIKHALKYSAILTLMYVGSSFVLYFALFKAFKVSLVIGLIYLVIQVADMLCDIIRTNIRTFLEIEHSPALVSTINLFVKAGRTAMSVLLMSPYNTNIAQITFDILALSIFSGIIIHYFTIDKIGFLHYRKKKIKVDKIVLYVDRKAVVC